MAISEVWKDIAGYEGVYKVSDKGNVRSVDRVDFRGRKRDGITLKPRYDKDGYLRVTLYKNGKGKNKSVHRLVLETFVPNLNNYPDANHRDEDKTNNELSNLEWCTRKQNVNHGTRNKKISQKLSKKVKGVNVETGESIEFNSTREAGNKGYWYGNVARACRGAHCGKNLYKGYRWYYVEGE